MERSEKDQSKWINVYAAAVSGTLIVVAFLISGRFPGGKRIFLTGDYYIQYIQFIKMFLRHLFSGESLAYSFELSMGMPTWAAYSDVCFNPWNIIFLLIPDIDVAAFGVMIGKLMLAAALFSFFVGRMTKAVAYMRIFLGAAYALCGYNICFYYNIQFLDGVYLLPLLVYLIYRLVYTGRMVALCLIYAYSFVVMFYTGYLLGVFSFLVWILMMWGVYGKQREKYIKCIYRYLTCVMIAVMLSTVVTLPTAIFLIKQRAEQNNGAFLLSVTIREILLSFLTGVMQGPEGRLPAVYSSIPALLLGIYFFMDRGISVRIKKIAVVIGVFLIICTFWTPAFLMLHGFDAPDGSGYRFAYLYSFCILTAAAVKSGQKAGEKDFWKAIVLGVAVTEIIMYLLSVNGPGEEVLSLTEFCTSMMFLGIYTLCPGWEITSSRRQKKIFMGAICAELVFNAFFCMIPDMDSLERSSSYYSQWQQQGYEAMHQIDQMEGNGGEFYRVYYENAMHNNNSMFLGYRGIGYFSSIEQPVLRTLLYRLGYATSDRVVRDYGSTPVMRMLLSQKYFVHATDPRFETEDAFFVKKNDQVLPIAFTVSGDGLDHLPEEDNVFQVQNWLVSTMAGEEIDVFHEYTGDIFAEKGGLQIMQDGEGWRISADNNAGGWLSFFVAPETDQDIFCYFSQKETANIGKSAMIGTTLDIGTPLAPSYLSMPHVMQLGKGDDGRWEVRIALRAGEATEASFQNMYFVYLDEAELNRAYQILSGSRGQFQCNGAEISGTIEVHEGKNLLFTSIPYDEGWTVYVDGKEADTLSVLEGAFLATYLTPGKHEILMRYSNRWINIGLGISFAGGLMLLILYYAEHQTRKKI